MSGSMVTSNLRRLRLGEEKKIERKIEEETTGKKYNGVPYLIGRPTIRRRNHRTKI